MGAVLGLGLSHYPLLSAPDEHLSSILRRTLTDPAIPAARKDSATWPEPMRAEWGDDEGRSAATAYRAKLLPGLRRVRAALDAFSPDVIVIWGDDQYENFQADGIPAFCVCAFPTQEVQPWANVSAQSLAGRPNVWSEPVATTRTVRGDPAAGKALATGLLEEGFDVAYAYRPLHHAGLAHAFLNAVLYLDYDRRGFDYPIVPLTINCYGRRAVARSGIFSGPDGARAADPPSPSPARCFDLGRAVARVCREWPGRVALIASSSWSHAFLVDKTHRLEPDVAADRRLYGWLAGGELARWRDVTLAEVEDAGQHELLNWFPLTGAMHEIGAKLAWSEMVETYVFTSTKVAAVFDPVS
jgi:hypothetical protein